MMEIKIQIPEGYEGIDEEKSNIAEGRIVFKKKESTPWRYNRDALLSGYFVTGGKVEKANNLYNVDSQRCLCHQETGKFNVCNGSVISNHSERLEIWRTYH